MVRIMTAVIFFASAVIMEILPNISLGIFVPSKSRLAAEGVSQGLKIRAGIFPGEGDCYFLSSPQDGHDGLRHVLNLADEFHDFF